MDFAWTAIAFLVTTVLGVALRDALRVPALQKRNYAGREIVTGAGVIAVFGFLLVAAVVSVVNHSRAAWLYDAVVIVFGFSSVGLLDDVVGGHGSRGFRGHLAALRKGRLTSGALKLIVGLAVATVATVTTEGFGVQVMRIVVIAGAANVANLFDLAPGRAMKASLVGFLPAVVLQHRAEYTLVGPLLFVAAVLALAPFEMREELMMGDAGANALGATIGFAWVTTTAGNDVALLLAAAVVVGINVAGELVSFSAVIDRVGPLRAIDRIGRRP